MAVSFLLASQVRAQTEYFDYFAEPDGPPAGWTIYSGNCGVVSEQLDVQALGTEAWVWTENTFQGDITLDYLLQFAEAGRCGGAPRGHCLFRGLLWRPAHQSLWRHERLHP